ncbi:hypothetical protein [Streptosporangium sp. NPDC051022]|uniref:hypothetical protein n=1 Tax=Streptosporangium sp. NPDC051022 TaxID=3155752 RepID=UPI00344A88B1
MYRLRSHAVAHRGTTVILCALGLMLMAVAFGGDDDVVRVPLAAAFMLLVAVLATHAILPSLVAGRRMPDSPPDDEEDGQDVEGRAPAGEGQRIEGKTAT